MNVLVVGMGVLGSLLAHELIKTNHEVTVLARNQRYYDLVKEGLTINHTKQKTTTTDKIDVISSLEDDHYYDVVFVVVQKSQLEDLLPQLAKNKLLKRIVFVGNNCEAEKTFKTYKKLSGNQNVLFGFLSCAGRREESIIVNWHTNACRFSIGSLDSKLTDVNLVKELLKESDLQIVIRKDINAWLKHHCAMVAPLALAIQYEGKADETLKKSETLLIAVNAVKECIKMFESQGIMNEPPHNDRLMNLSEKKWRWLLARLLTTKTGKIMAVDHSLTAFSEMEQLTYELLCYSKEYNYPLPHLAKLYELMRIKQSVKYD